MTRTKFKEGVCEICNLNSIKLMKVSTKGTKGTRFICLECIRDNSRFNNYGVTAIKYKEIQTAQDNRCAICFTHEDQCKRPGPGGYYGLVVDHCHINNTVRGLLCHSCNTLLGAAKDNPNTLRRAIDYLNGMAPSII